jgi:hypothetical protein
MSFRVLAFGVTVAHKSRTLCELSAQDLTRFRGVILAGMHIGSLGH